MNKEYYKKLALIAITMMIGISSLSYACGGGVKAPSDGGSSAPIEEGSQK